MKRSRTRNIVFALIPSIVLFSAIELGFYLFDFPDTVKSTESVLFTSRDGSSYSTAESMRRFFNNQSFNLNKPEILNRVIVLGGSTTYGRPYDDRTSFSNWLRLALPILTPEREWEIINAGGISYGSHRIAALIPELLTYKPDLFIVYTGHNEFLERTTEQNTKAISDIHGLAKHLRLYRWLTQVFGGSLKRSPDSAVDTLLDQSIGLDAFSRQSNREELVNQRFQKSIRDIIEQSKSAGVPIIFVHPASRLAGCKPFKSEWPNNLDNATKTKASESLSNARKEFAKGNFTQAIDLLATNPTWYATHADSLYLIGESHLRNQTVSEAKLWLQKAKDQDVCPLRMTTPLEQILVEETKSANIELINFKGHVESLSESGIPGRTEFLDHVHPTVTLHKELAGLILAAKTNLWPQYDTLQVTQALQKVETRIEQLRDPQLELLGLQNLAQVLNWSGKTIEAGEVATQAIDKGSQSSNTHMIAGLSAAVLGDMGSAKERFEAAVRLDPTNARALDNLGQVFLERREYERAKDLFLKAIASDPGYSRPLNNLGALNYELGDITAARKLFEQALKVEPDNPDALYNLELIGN